MIESYQMIIGTNEPTIRARVKLKATQIPRTLRRSELWYSPQVTESLYLSMLQLKDEISAND